MTDLTSRSRQSITDSLQSSFSLGIVSGLMAVFGGLVLALGGPAGAAAVSLAVLSTYAILRRLEVGFWAVIVVICLLPFATIPVDIGLTPTLLDLTLGATIGIWILRIATGQVRSVTVAPITIPLVVFAIVVVFSFIFGLGNGPLTPNLLRHFAELLLSMGFVVVVVDYCRSWDRLEKVVKVLLLAGAGAGGLSVFLWILPDLTANDLLSSLQRVGYPGGFVIRYIEDNPELAERAIGTAVDPNALGGLLLMIGALIGTQIASPRPVASKGALLLAATAVFCGLVLTFSRGAMAGMAAGLALVAVLRYRRLLPYMAVVAALVLLLPMTQGYVLRFVEGFQGADLATQMRFGEYRDALTLIGRYPLFGVGFSGSPDIDLYLGVASVYLTIGQQMGLLGLLAFGSVVASIFLYAYRNRQSFRQGDGRDAIWLGLHAALVGGLVAGIFDHYLFNIDFHHAVTVFWLFVGLATAASRLAGETVPGEDLTLPLGDRRGRQSGYT